MIGSLIIFGFMLAIGYFAFRPFHRHYLPGYGAFDWWTNERTSLRDYVFIYGFFLFVLGTGFLVTVRARGTGLLRIAQAVDAAAAAVAAGRIAPPAATPDGAGLAAPVRFRRHRRPAGGDLFAAGGGGGLADAAAPASLWAADLALPRGELAP